MTDTVTITREEYDRLTAAAEDLSDIQAFDRAKVRLDTGEDELIPEEYVARIIAGENPVRVYRELRGLSGTALAEASGVNRVQIIEIESGRKQGSAATLKKLADALGVMVDDLI